MSKRIIALLLCVVMIVPCLAACSKKKNGDLGAYITMYLTDDIYDFDPAKAFYNQDVANVVSMMFDTLFVLNDDGKVKKSLVKKYTVKEDPVSNEFYMELTLNETYWSNGTRLSAEDVVYAWKRLLNSANDFAAASLLYDIKNARAVKEGDESIDDIGIEAVELDVVRITFEGAIDYDRFLLNLTSIATAPLMENYVSKNADWAKKPSSMVTSGPYKLGKVKYVGLTDENGSALKATDDNALNKDGEQKPASSYELRKIEFFYLERNAFYNRDLAHDAIDATVKNYRILVDCTKTDAQIMEDYKNGKLFYIGSVPFSLRNDAFVTENAKVSNALSTFVCYLNENAMIGGEALFANPAVRQALSLAIDRTAIANEIVFAEAATGLVPTGVFNSLEKTKKDFRTEGGELVATTANVAQAQSLLTNAGITPQNYSFSIKVASYDETHVAIVNKIAQAWNALGFTVTVEEISPIANNDVLKELIGSLNDTPGDIADDIFVEAIERSKFEVIAFDYTAFSADPYSLLSGFAKNFSGGVDNTTFECTPHVTGYDSEAYNDLMEAIYYLPYFANFTEAQLADPEFTFLSIYDTKEEFMATYNKVKAVYDANGITPSTKSSDWDAQRIKLLHKAEEMLMTDLPVIPVVFNRHATITSKDLTKVSSTYYVPSIFTKTNLKDYETYTYVDNRGETVSIFAEFPIVSWDKIGR